MQTIKLNEGFDSLRHILKVKQIYPKSKSQVLYETTKYMRRLEFRLERLINDNIQLKKLMLTYHYGDNQKKKLAKPINTSEQAVPVIKVQATNKRYGQDRKLSNKKSPANKREFLNNLLFRKMSAKQYTHNEDITEQNEPSIETDTHLPKTSSQTFIQPLDLSIK